VDGGMRANVRPKRWACADQKNAQDENCVAMFVFAHSVVQRRREVAVSYTPSKVGHAGLCGLNEEHCPEGRVLMTASPC